MLFSIYLLIYHAEVVKLVNPKYYIALHRRLLINLTNELSNTHEYESSQI